MPRLPAIRVSYSNDANYLLRLVDAIERDKKRDIKWRQRMITLTRGLALEFINAPPASVATEEKSGVKSKKGKKP